MIKLFNLSLFTVNIYDGETLSLVKISRLEMGAYLCIASNGVPPSVSKRIIVDVECKCHNLLLLREFLFALIECP